MKLENKERALILLRELETLKFNFDKLGNTININWFSSHMIFETGFACSKELKAYVISAIESRIFDIEQELQNI